MYVLYCVTLGTSNLNYIKIQLNNTDLAVTDRLHYVQAVFGETQLLNSQIWPFGYLYNFEYCISTGSIVPSIDAAMISLESCLLQLSFSHSTDEPGLLIVALLHLHF